MAADTSKARNALADRQHKQPTVVDPLQRMEPQIKRALPKHVSAERLTRIALTMLRTSPDLQHCNPESFLASVMLSAQLGLEPGPLGQAYLVPYKGEVTFILGYKGILELARRSGQLLSIEARTVHANDRFDYAFGLEPRLEHVPADDDRGDPIKWYGVARFRGGGSYFEVLSRADIERYRKRSAAPNSPAWRDDYDAMAKKTVIRRMSPYLPLSVELQGAVAQDEQVTALHFSEDSIEVTSTEVEADPETGEVIEGACESASEPQDGPAGENLDGPVTQALLRD